MALLRHSGMPSLAAPAAGMEAQHSYLHSGPGLAAPRHPGKYVVESSPEASSRSEDEDEEEQGRHGGFTPDAEAANTPFSVAPRANHHHHPAHAYGGEGGEEGGEEPRSRLELIHEAPFPHRWPSRKRRKCRSLGYLALHAPTVDAEEEEAAGQPPSLSPAGMLPTLAATRSLPPAQPRPLAQQAQQHMDAHKHHHHAHPHPEQQHHFQQQQQQQRMPPAPPPYVPPPAPAAPPQRVGSLPPAGAPRALSKQLAATGAGAAGGKGGQARAAGEKRGGGGGANQHTAKKARLAAAGGAGSAAQPKAAAAAGSKPPGKPAGKPPGKPAAFKPSPSPQQPVRRLSSVTADRQRSGPGASQLLPAGASRALAGPAAAGAPRAGGPAAASALGGKLQASMGVGGQEFPPGQLVWAKMPSYPWWPAQVQQPAPSNLGIKHGASDVFVVFYGTADFNWVPRKDCKIFSHTLPDYTKHSAVRNKGLQRAIDEAWVALGRPRPDVNGKPHDG